MASSLSTRPAQNWAVAHPEATRRNLWALAPVGLLVLLLQLALSDGGRDAESLAWVQTFVFGLLTLVVSAGRIRLGSVARAGLLVTIVVAASLVWSVRPEATVRELLLWMMYLGIMLLAASTLTGESAARRFVDGIVVIAGWTALVALFNHWGAGNPGMRWSSTFYWPNPFAGFLLLVVPLELTRMVNAPSRREALAHGIIATLLAVSVLLTYSRGAWVALAVTLVAGAVVVGPVSWRAAIGRSLVLFAAVVAAVLLLTRGAPQTQPTAGIVGRASSIADAGDVSIQGRINFWRAGLRVFLDHPLGGTGAGTFAAVHPQYQQDVRFYAKDPHSLYVQVLGDLGVLGGIAIAVLVLALFRVSRAALRGARGRREYPMVAGIGLGLLAFFVHSGVEMNWSFPAGPAVAFAMAGVLVWYASTGPATKRPTSRAVRSAAVAFLLVAVVAVQVGYTAQRDYVAGLAFTHAGRTKDALALYTRAARWNPLSARYRAAVTTSILNVVPPDLDLALASMRRARQIDPRNAAHPYQMARVFMLHRWSDPQARREAAALLKETIGLDPLNWPEAYRALARLYLEMGRRDEARRVYAGAVDRYRNRALAGSILHVLLWPEVVGLTRDWSAFLAADGQVGAAAGVLESLLAQDSRVATVYGELARLYRRLGRDDEARQVLARGLAAVPTSEALWVAWRASDRRVIGGTAPRDDAERSQWVPR